MGIWKSLWKRNQAVKEQPVKPVREPNIHYLGGRERLQVVGESYYLTPLKKLLRAYGRKVKAVLIPEPYNKYDKNAICVHLVDPNNNTTQKVGYLARDTAVDYRDGVDHLMESTKCHVGLDAKLMGGTKDKPSIGVVLFHDPADFGVLFEEFEEGDEEE